MPTSLAKHFMRRHRFARSRAAGARNDVRFFVAAPSPGKSPLRQIYDRGGIDCARKTAANYRQMAEAAGRPVTRELYLRLAAEWESRAKAAEERLRGPQQSNPGELFQP